MNCEVARFIILTFFPLSPFFNGKPLFQGNAFTAEVTLDKVWQTFLFSSNLPYSRASSFFFPHHRPDRNTSALITTSIPFRWIFQVVLVDTMPPAEPERCAGLCRIWALVFALLLSAASVDGCPHKCSCSGSHVDCQGLGLKTVPKGVPRNAERL